MKKQLLLLLIFLIPLSSVNANVNFRQELKNQFRQQVQLENQNEAIISPLGFVNQIRNEIRNEIKEKNQNLLERIKNQVKEKLSFRAKVEGVIENIQTNQLTVKDNQGNVYTVNITDKTRLIRRFGGKSNLNEFKMGDRVVIFGKYTSDNKKTIEARLIRNLSIQKRWGVFFGEIISKKETNFVIKTINRGELTVYFTNQTKFLSHDKQSISYQNLKTSDRVRVKGVWDRDLKEIREVDEVRVFPKLSATPKVTVSEVN